AESSFAPCGYRTRSKLERMPDSQCNGMDLRKIPVFQIKASSRSVSLLLSLQDFSILWWLVGLANSYSTHLVLGNLRNGVLCGNRKLVGALASAPVIRDE